MNGFKNILASKTVLTTIVGAIFALLNVFGIIEISPDVQAGIVTALFAIAGFFRVQATEQLSVSSKDTAPLTP